MFLSVLRDVNGRGSLGNRPASCNSRPLPVSATIGGSASRLLAAAVEPWLHLSSHWHATGLVDVGGLQLEGFPGNRLRGAMLPVGLLPEFPPSSYPQTRGWQRDILSQPLRREGSQSLSVGVGRGIGKLSRAHAVVSFRGWGEGLVWVVGTHASLEVQGNHAKRNAQVPWEDCGKPPCLATWASNRCELGAEEPPCQPFAFRDRTRPRMGAARPRNLDGTVHSDANCPGARLG